MLALIIVLMGYQTFVHAPDAGTYAVFADGSSIIRTDTRTGKMERCSLAGNLLSCSPIVAQQ